jgi:hypothetical protein
MSAGCSRRSKAWRVGRPLTDTSMKKGSRRRRRGGGHGSRLFRQHVDQLFRDGVPAVGIDPHPENIVALRAFDKAGFAVARGPVETRWGWAVLMDRHAAVDHGEMS